MDSRSLDSQMCEVYTNVHKHIENRSDNEDARRYLKWELVSVVQICIIMKEERGGIDQAITTI